MDGLCGFWGLPPHQRRCSLAGGVFCSCRPLLAFADGCFYQLSATIGQWGLVNNIAFLSEVYSVRINHFWSLRMVSVDSGGYHLINGVDLSPEVYSICINRYQPSWMIFCDVDCSSNASSIHIHCIQFLWMDAWSGTKPVKGQDIMPPSQGPPIHRVKCNL